MTAVPARPARRSLVLLLLSALLVVLAGCGGNDNDGDADAGPTTSRIPTQTGADVAPAELQTTPFPTAGETLVQFVRAASRLDVLRMWGMMTEESRVGLGPTVGDFESSSAQELSKGLGALAKGKGFKVVFSEKIGDKYAVSAVASEADVEGVGRQYYAYGAALKPEGGRWKISLGSIGLFDLKPAPVSKQKPTPTLGVSVQSLGAITHAGLWLNGTPLKETGTVDQEGNVSLTAKPAQPLRPGRHVVIGFAAAADTASALAWTFSVE